VPDVSFPLLLNQPSLSYPPPPAVKTYSLLLKPSSPAGTRSAGFASATGARCESRLLVPFPLPSEPLLTNPLQQSLPICCPCCREQLPLTNYLYVNFALGEMVESLVSILRDYGSPPWQKAGTLTKAPVSAHFSLPKKMHQLPSSLWNRELAMATGDDPRDGDYEP